MKKFQPILLLILGIFVVISCDKLKDEIKPGVNGDLPTGKLSLSLELLDIDAQPASGRVADSVILDDYKVIIKKANGEDTLTWERYADVPAEVSLVVGEYYVVAHSNNDTTIAWNTPYYYGESEVFNIDKEEIKEIALTASMANSKLLFNYSERLKMDFTRYNAVLTHVSSGDTLDFRSNEGKQGYFRAGDAVHVEVTLEYDKVFEPEIIVRTLVADIPDPAPATLYVVNADAYLDDGKILITINIDDGVDVIEIDPVEIQVLNGPADWETIGATFTRGGHENGPAFGEITYNFSDINLADHNVMYWGPKSDAIQGSMDDDVFDDTGLNEILDFLPADAFTNLAAGTLAWGGHTRIYDMLYDDGDGLNDGGYRTVYTRMELSVFDDSSVPLALIDPTTVGMPASIGGLAEITSSGATIEARFTLYASFDNATWQSFISLYDDTHTPAPPVDDPDKPGNAVSSFESGFYWE